MKEMRNMKNAYPVILSEGKEYIVVTIPDFGINSAGERTEPKRWKARDAIGLMGIDMQDDGEALPKPTEDGCKAGECRGSRDARGCGFRRIPPRKRFARGEEELHHSVVAECRG